MISVQLSVTLLLAPQHSTQVSATSKKCKHANNIRRITTKAGTELRFIINTIIIIIGTNNKKICMKLKLEIILYVPGLVRKERTNALCLCLKQNKAYFGSY
jgi:hypothetical protein